MKDFAHFVITRINVRMPSADPRKRLDPVWLEKRLSLFDQFCYPSMRGQSSQNFKWLAFFDPHTPQTLRNRIKEYSRWEKFIPIYVEQFNGEVVREAITDHLNGKVDFLITSRLDTDDALCNDYIKIVQDNFCGQKREFINLLYGYALSNNKVYLQKYLSNHYLSLIEKFEGCKTVMCTNHKRAAEVGPIKNVATKPAWLAVLHDKNVSSVFRGGLRYPYRKLENDFTINLHKKDNILLCWLERIYYLMSIVLIKLQIALRRLLTLVTKK